MELLHSLLFMLCQMSPYILLGFFVAGILHAFVPQKTMAHHLSGTGASSVLKATLLGIPLPLCSCGVLPTAVAIRRNGASRACSTAFLIATPQTGVDSIAATWSLLGPAFAVLRPVAALVTAIFGGLAVGKTEKKQKDSASCESFCSTPARTKTSFKDKCVDMLSYGFVELVGSIGPWLVGGLIVAALITVYVPADFFSTIGNTPLLSMLAVLAIAVPMYVCATGSIPIALSLMLKGLSPGTALVLLMAGPAANFASFAIISKEMGRKCAFVYLLCIVIGAMSFGLICDYLLPRSWFPLYTNVDKVCCEHHPGLLALLCSSVLVLLLLFAIFKRYIHRNKIKLSDMTKTYIVKGMSCNHCRSMVLQSIENLKGVTRVDVDLTTGKTVVEGDFKDKDVLDAVRKAGYEIAEE